MFRKFCTSATFFKQPTNLKGKSTSSQHWLVRQLKDPYVEKAKILNYRCRSAFKLIEIDDRLKLFKPGQVIVDCGAAPGSWTQVAVKRVNSDASQISEPTGTVISVDRQQIYPIAGASIIGNSDFTKQDTQNQIRQMLGTAKVDVVLSDMAPNATGVGDIDNESIVNLCYTVLRFAVAVSEVGASLVMKLWQCSQQKALERDSARFYDNMKIVKPNSSRSDSAEIFLVYRNFKGLKTG